MSITSAVSPFFLLFLSTLILSVAGALQNTLLSVRLSYAGWDEQIIALTMSGYYIGMILGFFVCQQTVKRVGHIRAFTAFAATTAFTAIAHGLYDAPFFWFFLRVCSGICIASLYMVVESWVNERVESDVRGRVLALYMVVMYFGNGLGQMMLNVAPIEDNLLFMVLGMLFSICIVPISLTGAIHPKPLNVVHYNLLKLIRLAPFALFGSFMSGMINGSFYVMGPVYALGIGLDISQVTFFMTVTIWAGLFFQWPMGIISDRFDRLAVLSVLGFFTAVVCFAIALTGHMGYSILMGLSILFGVVFSIYPVAVARAQDNLDEENIVPISAALILSYSVGSGIGPLISSGVMKMTAPSGFYFFCTVCAIVLAVTSLYFRKHLSVDTDELSVYVPMPRKSPVISSLHPENWDENSL
ncbi:Predicted arabinose efflux permease, MFS family [Desulfocicer vacuolatum DSM 3385]|uniref:Predicted arabinose efflux permease, MFS family n=1 Tax=Desulfocicer vacuolatum DSM 3385 TaxID=1121400 RepID=A0A1W2CKM2_9BACT|nr:MFS transporter [Desulfocicer vacuolatum]SMC85442.1 Predicted arabinose efflux permease, MFS family [Desulfocicer vacuolatum DSM 3385]